MGFKKNKQKTATLAAQLCYFQSTFMGPGLCANMSKINWRQTGATGRAFGVFARVDHEFSTMGKGGGDVVHTRRQGKEVAGWFIAAASGELTADERFSRKGSGHVGALAAFANKRGSGKTKGGGRTSGGNGEELLTQKQPSHQDVGEKHRGDLAWPPAAPLIKY